MATGAPNVGRTAVPPASGPAATPTFINEVAAATGLDPNVIAAWVHVEGAYAPNGTGGNNFLNIRESTSRSGVPIVGTTPNGFAQFANASDAATEVSWWLNHMSNYTGIKASAKLGAKTQIAAIAASPWDAGHYAGGRSLYDSYAAVTKAGFSWGDVAGAITHYGPGLLNPVGSAASTAAGLLGDIPLPGVGTVSKLADAPVKTAESLLSIASDAGKAAVWLADPQHWLRTGYIIGGSFLVLVGLVLMARSVGGPAASTVAAVAAPETKLAKVAAAAGSGGGGRRRSRSSSPASPDLVAAKVRTESERTKEVRSRRRRNLESSRETRAARDERERKAYFRGAADASV